MEAVLRHHLANGEPLIACTGVQHNADHGAQNIAQITQLGLSPNTSIATAAKRMTAAMAAYGHPRHRIHYNGYAINWPLPAPDGQPQFSWLYLHSDYPRLNRWLQPLIAHANALLGVNATLNQKIRQQLPIPDDFPLLTLPLPIAHPPTAQRTHYAIPQEPTPAHAAPIQIGFVGRVEQAQKRIDRLPAFLDACRSLDLDYQFHVIGDGTFLPALKQQLADNPAVIFHGQCSGDTYWQRLQKLQFIVFFSDYEGLPIALLEAVSAGAVPIYPDFHAGADWPGQLGPHLLYPLGNPEAAAHAIVKVCAEWSPADWGQFHSKARQLQRDHCPENYLAAFADCLSTSVTPKLWLRPKSSFTRNLRPLWLDHRLMSWRQSGCHWPHGQCY